MDATTRRAVAEWLRARAKRLQADPDLEVAVYSPGPLLDAAQELELGVELDERD